MRLIDPEPPARPPALPLSRVLGLAASPFSHPELHPTQLRRVGLVGLIIGVPIAVGGVFASLALVRYFGSANKYTLLPGGYGACIVVVGLYRIAVGLFPVIARVAALRMLLLLVLFIAFSVFAFALLVMQ